MGQSVGDELHLVEIVLGLAGYFDFSVLLDIGNLWAELVMTVGVSALWAGVFHWVGVLGVNRRA